MKNFLLTVIIGLSMTLSAQSGKSKSIKIKYTLPAGWNVEEFGGKTSWDEAGGSLCKCSYLYFYKAHKDGKMNILVYPSSQGGLDSAKRNFVGPLVFQNVEKYDKTRNKSFSFERKKSNFIDAKTKSKSYEAFRYQAKIEDRYYIIYAWQESMNALNSVSEKELYEMVNGLEPL